MLLLGLSGTAHAAKKRAVKPVQKAMNVPAQQPTKQVSAPLRKSSLKELNQAIHKASDESPAIEFNFENADLQNIVSYIAELFDISFIAEEAIKPMLQTSKGLSGNKISFKTERPMTKKEVWALFTTFLDISGLALSDTPRSGTYRITASKTANHLALPTFIGVSPKELPDTDRTIRYVYFLANTTVENIKPIIDQLRSQTSSFTAFLPLRALVLTDNSYNIKSLMKIVQELDKASLPEIMSVIKLKHTGAEDVKKLYDELTKGDDQRGMVARIFGAKKQAQSFFFSENTRVLAEPRTNTLILFGTQDTITKIEEFVKQVDTKVESSATPLYVYELQFTDAQSMAEILNKVTQFGIGTVAGQAGGLRDGEKYFKAISFTPEKTGNRLIIKGDYEDYLKAKEIIEKLDIMQPEIAMEVLIVNVTKQNTRGLGSQVRNRAPDALHRNVNFQTSGFNGSFPQTQRAGADMPGSIMANLINLASTAQRGASLLTLGADNNIWAIFQALSTRIDTTVVSNPFLVTTNKYKASVSLGETRRVETSTVLAGAQAVAGRGDLSANLEVSITPQINSDGIIILDIVLDIDEFTNPVDQTSGNRATRHIETKALVADKEVLALGGIMRKEVRENVSKIPVLGDIPLLGWLAKNKSKEVVDQNLLVFISPQIIAPKIGGGVSEYTQRKAEYSRQTLRALESPYTDRDPIHRWFFKEKDSPVAVVDDFLEKKGQARYEDVSKTPFYKSKIDDVVETRSQKRAPITTIKKTEVRTKKPKRSLLHFVREKEGADA
jgi:general secretion pathway protein D